MFTFTFTKEELFAVLNSFKGNQRRSIIGMFKSCSNVETALSVAYFLRKHKLGGLKVKARPNSIKFEIYLNKVEKVVLPKIKTTKVLLFV